MTRLISAWKLNLRLAVLPWLNVSRLDKQIEKLSMPIWKRWKRRIASKTLLTCTIVSSTKMSLRMIQASSLTKMILSSKFQSREGSHVACRSLGSPFSQKIKWMSLVKSQTRRLLASLKVASRLSTKKNKGRTTKKNKRRWVKSLT